MMNVEVVTESDLNMTGRPNLKCVPAKKWF